MTVKVLWDIESIKKIVDIENLNIDEIIVDFLLYPGVLKQLKAGYGLKEIMYSIRTENDGW